MPKNVLETPEVASSLNGALSEAEVRFERFRRSAGLFLGPLVFI